MTMPGAHPYAPDIVTLRVGTSEPLNGYVIGIPLKGIGHVFAYKRYVIDIFLKRPFPGSDFRIA